MKVSSTHRLLLIMTLAAVGLLPSKTNAQTTEEGSQGSWRNAKAANVAQRSPGLRIRAAVDGPEITQTQEQKDAPSRLQQMYIDIINVLFVGLNQLIPLLPELFPGNEGPVGIGELVITEVANDGNNSFIEVYNPSGVRIELDDWAFCQSNGCTSQNELAGRVMEAGDILVFQLDGQLNGELANGVITIQVGTTADDIGVYDFTGASARDPLDSVAMIDYLQWGDIFQSFGLEDTAIAAGLWVANTSITEDLEEQSFQLRSGALQIGGNAMDYIVVPFSQNSLGALTPANLESEQSGGTVTAKDTSTAR